MKPRNLSLLFLLLFEFFGQFFLAAPCRVPNAGVRLRGTFGLTFGPVKGQSKDSMSGTPDEKTPATSDANQGLHPARDSHVADGILSASEAANLAVDATRGDEPPTPPYSVFSPKTKIFIVLMTAFSTLFSPFSSFIYFPAITPIAESYHRSLSELNLTVTVYQIMQAVAPLFFGDLSDQIGRRPVYMLTFAIYLGANTGLALQHNYAALMVLRALQSTGSSATVAIGSAVMADITTSAERGGYITAVQASAQFAPALAPVLGGILTQFLGWRSTFWFLAIAAGVFLVIYLPFAPEVSMQLKVRE